MIVSAALAVLAVVLVGWAVDVWAEPRRERRRHAACLQRVDRLERDLFPEWFPAAKPLVEQWFPGSTRKAMPEIRPGAVWQLSDPDLIQYHRPELRTVYCNHLSASSWTPTTAERYERYVAAMLERGTLAAP